MDVGGDPAEELHAGRGVPVPDAGGVPLRQRQLRAGPRPGAPDDRLPEVPGRAGGRAEAGHATWVSGSRPTSRPAGPRPRRWRARSAPRRASGRAPRCASPRPGRSRSSRARTPTARGTRPPSPSWRPTSCRCPSRTSRSSTATPGPFPSAWAPTAAARPPWADRRSTARSRRSRRRARRSPRTSWRRARPTSSITRASSGCKGSPGRVKTFGEVALMAYLAHNLPKGLEPGLEATSFWDPSNFVLSLRDPHRDRRGGAPRPAR